MGWFNTVLNIGSTIGKVCGALQGGGNVAAHFGMAGSVNANMGGLVIYNDTTVSGSPLTAANQCVNQQSLTLDFLNNPLVGNLPQSIILPYMSKIAIGPAFKTASSGGNEAFTATFAAATLSDDIADPPQNTVTVQAASNTVLNPGATIQIGSYFSATLNDRTIAITAGAGFVLAGLVLLNVRGASGNLARVIRAFKSTSSDIALNDVSVSVDIPFGIDIANGIPYIEVAGLISSSSEKFGSNHGYSERLESLSEADVEHIKALTPVW